MTPSHRARALLADPRTIILDTETTGLKDDAQIVEIAVINCAGDVLIDTLVWPTIPIPEDATLIHGITNHMAADAPPFAEIWPQLRTILDGKIILSYNIDFDTRLILQSLLAADIQDPYICDDSDCIMILAADHLRRRKWCNLATAAWHLNCDQQQPAHRALGDAKTALAVLKAIAGPMEEGQAK